VKNPTTTAPSSVFSNMVLLTSDGYYISKYVKTDVKVTTAVAGTISSATLVQGN
jgi:hypothetical protein